MGATEFDFVFWPLLSLRAAFIAARSATLAQVYTRHLAAARA